MDTPPAVDPGPAPLDLFGLSRADLEALCARVEVPRSHARTLMRLAYRDARTPPGEAERSLPARLREAVEAHTTAALPIARDERRSERDATVKFALELPDGRAVESVLMPERRRITLCVSSQVGCGQGCVFCHTARMGLVRQLGPGEIVAQVVHANRWIDAHPEWLAGRGLDAPQRVANVVFMGMGEPLDNVDAVVAAVRVLTDPCGLALAPRRITVSTAGHLDGLGVLARDCPKVSLALSLHAVDERLRARLMPISRRWPLAALTERLRPMLAGGARALLVQHTLIAGLNDGTDHARALLEWIRGFGAEAAIKVNLIPLNEIEVAGFRRPEAAVVAAFRDLLHHGGVRVMVRHSKGGDVAAACGQLALVDQA